MTTRKQIPPRPTYVVIYRTGGPANFKWHRSVQHDSREDCAITAAATRKMGYRAFTELYSHSMSVGLPETFDAHSSL